MVSVGSGSYLIRTVMNEFQKAWLEGYKAAESRIAALLMMLPNGTETAIKIMGMKTPIPPLDSRVEVDEVGGSGG